VKGIEMTIINLLVMVIALILLSIVIIKMMPAAQKFVYYVITNIKGSLPR